MYQTPTKADIDRILSVKAHEARRSAESKLAETMHEFVSRGVGMSTGVIGVSVQDVDKVHGGFVLSAMGVLSDLAGRMDASVDQIIEWARPHLERLGGELLSRVPAAGFPEEKQRVCSQYTSVFRQRIDNALHDFRIGFVAGRSVVTNAQTSQARALNLLRAIYNHRNDNGDPVFISQLASEAGLTEIEAQDAWRYLRDKQLIDTFRLEYTARINASGIDAIEEARRNPAQTTGAFPQVTYNVVNVGTAYNSPIQQAGAQSTQTQTVNYGVQERTDLSGLVREFTKRIDELGLDDQSRRRAIAQLGTIEAQLSDEPDPVIVKQAGRTLRSISEKFIVSLLTSAADPTWQWIMDVMARLFP